MTILLLLVLQVLPSAADIKTGRSAAELNTATTITLSGDLKFGAVQVGGESLLDLVMTNTGKEPIKITKMMGSSNDFAFYYDETLKAGQQQKIKVAFRPTKISDYHDFAAFYTTAGTKSVNLSGSGTKGLFKKTGVGDTVFELPADIQRIRISAEYLKGGNACENFIVDVDGHSLVNVILGGCSIGSADGHLPGSRSVGRSPPTFLRFEGTYRVTGRVIKITKSTGVAWQIDEQ
jgi:HYDIN/CFA65/VesB-like, Ig-like domain